MTTQPTPGPWEVTTGVPPSISYYVTHHERKNGKHLSYMVCAEHPQRILDLLDDRRSFVDVRETCAECVRLMRAMGAHECADEYEAQGVRDIHGEEPR